MGPKGKKLFRETEQHNSSDSGLEKSVSHDFPHLGKINTFNDQVGNLLRVFCLHVGFSTATLCYKNTPDTYAQNVRIRNDAHHTLPTDDTQKQETPHRQTQVHFDLGQEAVPYPRPSLKYRDQRRKRMRMGRCAPGNTRRPSAFPIKYAPWTGIISKTDLPKRPPGRTAPDRPSAADPNPHI